MTSFFHLGIDEAGRGPVLGPLVMAGLQVPRSQLNELHDLGVQDSKGFGSHIKAKERRKQIAEKLMAWPHQVVIAEADEVDHWVYGEGLNALERSMAQKIIKQFPDSQVTLDGEGIFKALCGTQITAHNKADQNYLEVAGASIIAKHIRDQAFNKSVEPFKDEYGPVKGGGYPNSNTYHFVSWHHQSKGHLPAFFRYSYQWKAIAHLR